MSQTNAVKNKSAYSCLVSNQSISEQQCIKFQAGESPTNFYPDQLPCLKCEGLIRPSIQMFNVISNYVPGSEFFQYQYNDFFVFGHSLKVLAEKMKVMLEQMDVPSQAIFELIGDEYVNRQHLLEGIQYYKQAEHFLPSSQISLKLGKAYYQLHEYNQALSHLQKAKSMDSHTYIMIGKCFEQLNQSEQAEKQYEKAAILGVNDDHDIEALAVYYYKQIDQFPEEQQKYIGKAINSFNNMIDKQWRSRQSQMIDLKGRFILDSKDIHYFQYARLQFLSEDYQKAIEGLEKYTKLFPFTSKQDVIVSVEKGLLLMELSADLDTEKMAAYCKETIRFFNQLFPKLYELLAKCYLRIKEYDRALQMVQYAAAFDYFHPDLEILAQSIEMQKHEVKNDDRQKLAAEITEHFSDVLSFYEERLLALETSQNQHEQHLKNIDHKLEVHDQKLSEIDEKVKYIERSLEDFKQYVDARFVTYNQLEGILSKRFPNWDKRTQYIEKLLSPDLYKKFCEFDERTDQSLKKQFTDRDIQEMAKIVDVWATGEWIYHQYEELMEQSEQLAGIDASFIVVSYFKALEITLAKKIGELSKGEYLLHFNRKQSKAFPLRAFDDSLLVIGTDLKFYKETIGKYNQFLKYYQRNYYHKYKKDLDPVKAQYQSIREQLSDECRGFTNKHRNKCSHKSSLAISEVGNVRTEFNHLMKQLLESFRN